MKRLGRWLTALCLLGMVVAWAVPSGAEVPPGYEPQVKLLNPQEYQDDSVNHSGKSALANGEIFAKQAKSGGFWGWLGDHGMGLVKGIGAGLIGAAIVVAAAAVIIGAGAPLLLMAGAAVIGGAIYGAIVGSARFNWKEAIVGSVIGGVSAGVGSWIAGSASPVIARVGAAAADMIGGGIGGVASYLVNEPTPTWGGAAVAFGIGAGMAGLFLGGGAVVSKGFTWAKGAVGFSRGSVRSTNTNAIGDLVEDSAFGGTKRSVSNLEAAETVATPSTKGSASPLPDEGIPSAVTAPPKLLVDLEARAKDIHGVLPTITQNKTTIAVAQVRSEDGTRGILVASSEARLRPAQRAALRRGEVEVHGQGHAEATIIDHASENGQQVEFIAASRPVCASCAKVSSDAGANVVSPLKEYRN